LVLIENVRGLPAEELVTGAKIVAPGMAVLFTLAHWGRLIGGTQVVLVEGTPPTVFVEDCPESPENAKYVPAPAITITMTKMIAPIIGDMPPPDLGAVDEGGMNSSVGDLAAFGGVGLFGFELVAIFHSWKLPRGVNPKLI
jgi:hypothetical protein